MAGAALITVTACASNPGRSSAKVPLDIPEPPPRVAMDPVPAIIETPPVEKPVAATTPAPARTPSPTPPPAPAVAAATPPASPPVAQGPEPVRVTPPELRPAASAGATPTIARVRERSTRTRQKLDAIDRRRLNAGQRSDYDSARRFLSQADSAVKANNLLLAESSLEKAETLADGLR
jgi:hypothetical protein